MLKNMFWDHFLEKHAGTTQDRKITKNSTCQDFKEWQSSPKLTKAHQAHQKPAKPHEKSKFEEKQI